MESEVDSRLVSHQDGNGRSVTVLFESYDHLSENNWSCWCRRLTTGMNRPQR